MSGIFIKRQALSVSNYCDVAVLYVHVGMSGEGIEISKDQGLTEVRVYRRWREYKSPFMRKLYNHLFFYLDYLVGGYLGYRAIKREFGRPDLVHVNVATYAGLMGLALKVLQGLPYVLTEHWTGYLECDGDFYKHTGLGRRFILEVAKNSQAIITVSSALRDAMISCGAKGRFYVVPNVVDLNCSLRVPSRDCQEKKKIAHISLMKDNQKNVSGIIDAVGLLSQMRDDFELHLIGDGPDRQKIEARALELGLLNKTVFFHGLVGVEELAGLLSISAFMVINSNFETFCVAAAESLVCGLPVIATRCGGPEEFVDERCGILIDPGDRAALVRALDYMLDHLSEFNSEEICEKARSLFSPKIVGKKIYDVYREVLQWNG